MNSVMIPAEDRSSRIDYVSSELLPQAALLIRLLVRQLAGELTRTEVGLLKTLSGGPRRITELAELEGLAQPTTTLLVKQLEQRGFVRRERRSDDGRVVLVDLTDAGTDALGAYRAGQPAAAGAQHTSSRRLKQDEQVGRRSPPLLPRHSRISSHSCNTDRST